MRLIDIEPLQKEHWHLHRYVAGFNAAMVEEMGLEKVQTVDAEPVKHGRWIHCKGKSSIWYCSVCGEKILYNPTRKTYKPDKKPVWEINKYCRNCGALMKAGGEDEST